MRVHLLAVLGAVMTAGGGIALGQPVAASGPSASDSGVAAGQVEPGAPAAAGTATTATTTIDAAVIDAIVDRRLEARLAAQKPTAGWNDGFFVQTADGKSRLKIGGVMQFDGRFFVAEGNDPHTDQFGFRSIRPELQGTLFEHFDFRMLPDFAGGRVQLQDVYADLRYSERIKLRFGKFKVPFGLERLQSETSTTFVERGLPTLLTPNRDLGIQLFGELAGGILAYQVGLFNGVADGASGDGDVSDDKEFAARVFVRPFARGAARLRQLGAGAAITHGDKTGSLASPDVPAFRTQGQTQFFGYRTGTTVMDTVIADGNQLRMTGQAHWYAGPLGVLAEYVRSIQTVALGDRHASITADAWQVVGQWVVTGDAATYRSVTPNRPFDPSKGQWGAFDVAARIGELRLVDSKSFDAGVADPMKSARRAWSAGAGADWFPNRNFRVVLDLERTWYSLGAKSGDVPVDRAAETSIIGRVQTVF